MILAGLAALAAGLLVGVITVLRRQPANTSPGRAVGRRRPTRGGPRAGTTTVIPAACR
jgi:hypothetical protein